MPILPAELLPLIVEFAPLFSKPVWEHVKVLLVGALLATGKRTVTACLRVTGKSQEIHFQNYHRVLNRARWSALAASQILLRLLVATFAPKGNSSLGLTTRSSGGVAPKSKPKRSTVTRCDLPIRILLKPVACVGSAHASGKRYRWKNTAPIAEAPEWFLRLLRETQKSRANVSAAIGATIPEGYRNDTLTSLAGTMRRRGMGAEEIEAALLVTKNKRCNPPLATDEVKKIASSVCRYKPAWEAAFR